MRNEITKMFRCELCSDDQHETAAQAKRCCKGDEYHTGAIDIFWQCDECYEEFSTKTLARNCKHS